MLHIKEEDIDRLTEALHNILGGQLPTQIELPADYPDNEVKQLVEYVNRFISQHEAFGQCMSALFGDDGWHDCSRRTGGMRNAIEDYRRRADMRKSLLYILQR